MGKGFGKMSLFNLSVPLGVILALTVGCAKKEVAGGMDKISQVQAAAPEINLGILVPYTGELGAYGNYWFAGAKVAVDEINASGGVLGKKIKIFTEDTETSVEQGIRAAQKLVNVNRVIAIHGTESSVSVAIYPFCAESQVMLSNPAGGTTRLDKMGTSYFQRTCPSDAFEGVAVARMLQDYGLKHVLIMYENDESRVSSAEALKSNFEALGGKVTMVSYAPRQTSYLAELKKGFAEKPDAFFLAGGQESGATVIKEWYQRKYGAQLIVTGDMTVPEFFAAGGLQATNGSWGEMPMADTSLPEYQQFAKVYLKNTGKETSGSYESNSYDGMNILCLAIAIAGEATGKGISDHFKETSTPGGVKVTNFAEGVAALAKGQKIDYSGASGPCDFNQYGNTVGSYVLMEGKNGKWVQKKFYPTDIFADFIKKQ
jgi:branched-chain amino acid transport system substrate-binding protein